MSYRMHENHFQNVMNMSSNERLHYFVNKVADWEQLWGVKDSGGWLVPTNNDGFTYFPVWPHPLLAKRATDQRYSGCEVTEIGLDLFLTELLPKCSNAETIVGVCPNMDWIFWGIEPLDLAEYLVEEASSHECLL